MCAMLACCPHVCWAKGHRDCFLTLASRLDCEGGFTFSFSPLSNVMCVRHSFSLIRLCAFVANRFWGARKEGGSGGGEMTVACNLDRLRNIWCPLRQSTLNNTPGLRIILPSVEGNGFVVFEEACWLTGGGGFCSLGGEEGESGAFERFFPPRGIDSCIEFEGRPEQGQDIQESRRFNVSLTLSMVIYQRILIARSSGWCVDGVS